MQPGICGSGLLVQRGVVSWPSTKWPLFNRPENWKPECADDVPLELSGPVGVLTESDDLFEAVSRAMEHNESDEAKQRGRWAVVVEPGSVGRVWPAARLCTPITYKVTAIWWPDGWEPHSPLDVPNCVWQAQGRVGGECLSYPQAEATVLGLNRQCMDHPGTTWHVVVAVENEAVSRNVSYDPAGTETTVEVRRMHVIRPERRAATATARTAPPTPFNAPRPTGRARCKRSRQRTAGHWERRREDAGWLGHSKAVPQRTSSPS